MRKENAFTLAETMIVIVVLGIIATLTIPALVNKNKESVAKTKVRKAMAAYESALNKMIIENDLKSDTALNEWASATANCGNPSNYFKKVQIRVIGHILQQLGKKMEHTVLQIIM